MKKLLKALLAVVVIIAVISAGSMVYLSRGLEEGRNVVINGVDLSNVGDGKYTGDYDSGRWANKVEVTVKDHKITDIKILDDVSFSKPELSAELFSRVIRAQDTKVDAVSQATVTSKAYLKAIEDALN